MSSHIANAAGIDVSDAGQGVFDWQAWEGHLDFAMCKATQGDTFIDPEFKRNWTWMKELSLLRFAYHWGEPWNSPVPQVNHFVEVVKDNGLDDLDGLVIDIEVNQENPTAPVIPAHEIAFWTWCFSQRLLKIAPFRIHPVYSFPAFIDAGNLAMSGERPLYIADWGVPKPELPGPWAHRDWTLWQYASGGRNRPDLDQYNGTRAEMEKALRNLVH